jgi:hypothetical protein
MAISFGCDHCIHSDTREGYPRRRASADFLDHSPWQVPALEMAIAAPISRQRSSLFKGLPMSDATVTATKETLGFQTEVKQLLQLMIHSLYSNREIFLRS